MTRVEAFWYDSSFVAFQSEIEILIQGSLDRLRLLNARSDDISRKEIVMSINLIYDEIEKICTHLNLRSRIFNHEQKSIHLNEYNTENAKCITTLIIVFKAYIEWASSMQQNFKHFEFAKIEFEDDHEAWFVINHILLSQYQVRNAQKVVERLWKMYFASRNRSLIKFDEILKNMMKFYTTWIEMQKISLDKADWHSIF